jgi:hypothetical protein
MEVDDSGDVVISHPPPPSSSALLPLPSFNQQFTELLHDIPSSLSSLFEHIYHALFVLAFPVYSHLLVHFASGDLSVLSHMLENPPLRPSSYVGVRGVDSADWREWNPARCFELMDRYYLTAFEDLYIYELDPASNILSASSSSSPPPPPPPTPSSSPMSPKSSRWASSKSNTDDVYYRTKASSQARSNAVRSALGLLKPVFLERKKSRRTVDGYAALGAWAHPESCTPEQWETMLRHLSLVVCSGRLLDKPVWAESANGWIGGDMARQMVAGFQSHLRRLGHSLR